MKLPQKRARQLAERASKADLGDVRLSRRAGRIAERHARDPRAPLPEALESSAELEAAYRFMSNPRVTLDALIAPHVKEAAARAREAKLVLAIHDTTTCKFAHADPAIIGFLNTGKAGFMVHYTLLAAFGDFPRPLGVAQVDAFFRGRPPRKGRKGRRRPAGQATTKKPVRESQRWLRGIEATAASNLRSNVVHVADRESDSFELLSACVEHGYRFVFRVRVPTRRVWRESGTASLQQVALDAPAVLAREVVLSRRTASSAPRSAKAHHSRSARPARLQISATRVELDRPRYFGSELPEKLSVNVVSVVEVDCPAGEQPVEWMLFTGEPIDTPKRIERIVEIYRCRWLIEECNKALKTGCLYEHRQFESREALLVLLGLSLPIACAILGLRTEARRSPTQPATNKLTDSQLAVLRHFSPLKLPEAPSLKQALLAIAALGGHQHNNGPPGWLVIQRGMTRMLDYDEGWRAALASQKM